MNEPYIFESVENQDLKSNEAIIVLPDIYCQTDYSKHTVEEFATAFRKVVKELFAKAGADFHSYEYEAGHAYFQEGRKNFNEVASKASWGMLKQIFNERTGL